MLISYKAIGRNIRTARKKTGKTQEQIARELGISLLHYGRLERGERPASLEQLAAISQTLGTPLSALLNGCAEGEAFGEPIDPGAKTLGDDVAQIAAGCSPQAQELMLALCRTVAVQDKKAEIG